MPAHSELRVHGVSGSPPRTILYTDPITSDPDDDYTRVFRRRSPDQTTTADGTVHKFDAKAFHWGGLTSGHWITAFWMLLSPFAFVNVAGWMTTSNSRLAHLTIRLAGLGLTGLFVVQLGYVFLEIPAALSWGQFWLASMALVYVLFISIFIVMWLSTQSHFSAHMRWVDRLRITFHPRVGYLLPTEMWGREDIEDLQWDDPAGAGLSDDTLWGPHAITNRIRRLHLGYALAVMAIVLSVGVEAWWIRDLAIWVSAAVAVLMAATTFAPRWPISSLLTAWTPLAGLYVVGWAVLEVFRYPPEAGSWPQINVVTFGVALVLGAAAITSLVAGLRSLGAIGLGALFGGSLGIGAALTLESAFGLDRITGEGAGWVAVAMLGLVITLLMAAVIMMLIPLDGRLPERGKFMASIRRVTRRGPWLFIVAALYSITAGLGALVGGCEIDGGATCDPANLAVPDGWGVVVSGATWLVILIPTGFILRSLLMSVVTRSSNRHVGILWDLASFWPRWFHPLAPPAYGPKIVEDLRAELEADPPDLLEAHSQGSVIAAATLGQMGDVGEISLITYGSPLGILYSRLFPLTDVETLVANVDTRLGGRWRNLWRVSDPLGGEEIGLGDADIVTATGTGHNAYEVTGEFKRSRLALLSRS